ncbi:MAG TPA: trypsin-like serine protease [Polyangiaceae bacterium]|nr:trypsin-like serine protease [Polyangiaceae bacterium]
MKAYRQGWVVLLPFITAPLGCALDAPTAEEGARTVDPVAVEIDDNRVPQTDNSTFPWSGHVALRFQNENGRTGRCSGALLGVNTILTAAHCIWRRDRPGEEFHQPLWLATGYDSADVDEPTHFGPWSVYDCAAAYFPDEFRPDGSDVYDYAVVDISACPQSTSWTSDWGDEFFYARSWMASEVLTLGSSFGGNGSVDWVTIAGYPTDAPQCPWPQLCEASGWMQQQGHLLYTVAPHIYTSSGQSGTPILEWSAAAGNYQVTGIHLGNQVTHNYGRILDSAMYDFIVDHSVDL